MKTILRVAVLTLILFLAEVATTWAGQTTKKPLEEVFNSAVVVPFNYCDKVFVNGHLADVYGDYELYQRDGRVLVPIRLMGYLITEADRGNGYWEVAWDQQKPDMVILNNYKLSITVKLEVKSKTMYINGEPNTLDAAPQSIEGRIVLPLRGISEALDKNISWYDGLIFISDDIIDLQSPRALGIVDKIKTRLEDKRGVFDDENRVAPLTKYGNDIYYIKTRYHQHGLVQELYKRTGTNPEVKIELPGEEWFVNSQIINNELYYVSTANGKSEMHVFSFAGQTSRKLCELGQWNPEDGWLGDMKYIDNDFYIILHTGDWTMGAEVLCKLENDHLKEIAGAKNFINFAVAGDYLYYVDFSPMNNFVDNLYRVNIQTGEKDNLGEQGFVYGVVRTIDDQGVGYSGSSSFYIKDGYIYTLGYQAGDETDKSSVYKISLDGQTQSKITLPAKAFWLFDNVIYYTVLSTGYLVKTDLEGNNKTTLVNKGIIDIEFFDGSIYYTAAKNTKTNVQLGELYRYNMATGQEIQLSNQPVSKFFVGRTGVYYQAEGYDLGLYKIDTRGNKFCLLNDSILDSVYSGAGVVYTMRYAGGIYAAE